MRSVRTGLARALVVVVLSLGLLTTASPSSAEEPEAAPSPLCAFLERLEAMGFDVHPSMHCPGVDKTNEIRPGNCDFSQHFWGYRC